MEAHPLDDRRLAGRYVLDAEIARGGMGTVWRARDEVLGRAVAVKVLHESLAREARVLDRFRLEAVAAARLSHPCVVRVFDTGVDDGTCYIVMELFDGSTLEDIIKARGPLEPAEAAGILRSVLHGLGHAHRQGVVHRDVKPSNVLVDRTGQVKVTDFGIAKAAFAHDLTTTGSLLGTAGYLAPEQISGEEVDARTDAYAAGVVLYESLTGRPPFVGHTHIATATMRLTTDPVPPGALRPGIPRGLEEAVLRALERDPARRFQSADEMAAALDRAVPQSSPAPPAPAPAPDHASRRASTFRSWVLVPLMILLAAGAAVGAFLGASALFDGSQEPSAAGPGADRGPGAIDAVAVASHDPPPGDGEEHDSDLPEANDDAVETYWTTEGYESPDLGGFKDGVGIVFDLGEPTEVAAARIQTDLPGWRFRLYAADSPDGFALDQPITFQDITAETTSDVPVEGVTARYWMVWIVDLVPADDGKYRAHVNEADFFPPS